MMTRNVLKIAPASRTAGLVSSSLLTGLVILFLCGQVAIARPVETGSTRNPKNRFFGQVELSPAFLSKVMTGTGFLSSLGYALRCGYRWRLFEISGQIEHNLWLDSDMGEDSTLGTLNMGLGLGLVYFDEHLRSTLTLGISTMLFDGRMDDAGTTGFFLDMRPAGIRWRLNDRLWLELHPLALQIEIPSVARVPIANISFRTIIALEAEF